MKDIKGKSESLEKELIAAHRERGELELSTQWRQNLMRDIHLHASKDMGGQPVTDNLNLFTSMLFRFAGAGAVIAVILCLLYASQLLPNVVTAYAELILEDPLGQLIWKNFLWS
ncbi:MAG: hypothetical protein PVG60_04270 [Desulfarculaceae bacterium]|jgi:hypothetical protein